MKYLPLLALIALSGCQTLYRSGESKYTKLTVTDARGEPIADWIAEGHLHKTDTGFEIQAVERRTPRPDSMVLRYPNRRAAFVVGPNIVLETVDKPIWLQELDGPAQ